MRFPGFPEPTKPRSRWALRRRSRPPSCPPARQQNEALVSNKVNRLEPRPTVAQLDTPTDLSEEAVREIAAALNALLADTFALYVKTKNFHWHVTGPHFRDYHLLLDDHAQQLEKSIDILAERVRKVGGTTIRSIAHIATLQRIEDNDADYVPPRDMLLELMNMRNAHKLVDDRQDVATASLLEIFIDEAEKRCWFLFEASRQSD
ncbi:MAG: DNA starvation/stationary phase protection protein [Alphaproteobacteria bacterium]|nr:MAG: DNA starvation/stationary phase protection protein [Alphaproteobacteria bacterium]